MNVMSMFLKVFKKVILPVGVLFIPCSWIYKNGGDCSTVDPLIINILIELIINRRPAKVLFKPLFKNIIFLCSFTFT